MSSPVLPEKQSENENIFLLEFIVDKVSLEFCTQNGLKCIGGQTCVSYSFLNNGPFSICEEDFQPKMMGFTEGCTGTGNIKNGKSCLFSLTSKQAEDAKRMFIIHVQLFKTKNVEIENENILIGKCMIPIMPLFRELMDMVAEGQSSIYAKTFKDCIRIINPGDGDLVGHLSVYIRLSCFGKIIINEFKMNTDQTIDFKATQGNYMYKYSNKPPTGSFLTPPPCPPECPPVCPPSCPLLQNSSLPQCPNGCPPPSNGNLAQYPQSPPCPNENVSNYPICTPPTSNPRHSGALAPGCPMRSMPCCSLPCHLFTKTCPCQQRIKETQLADMEDKNVKFNVESNGKEAGKGKKGKGKKK